MKKSVWGFLIVIVFFSLAGCGSNNNTEENNDKKIQLSFWNFWSKGGGEEKFLMIVSKILRRCTQMWKLHKRMYQ